MFPVSRSPGLGQNHLVDGVMGSFTFGPCPDMRGDRRPRPKRSLPVFPFPGPTAAPSRRMEWNSTWGNHLITPSGWGAAVRSLQDDEETTAAGTVTDPGAALQIPAERSGVGTASLRWKPSVDRTGVCSLLAYLRTCVRREAVHYHSVREDHLGTDVCACLPAGPEALFSGSEETLATDPDTFRVARRAQSYGQSLRYGYPLVLTGEGNDRVALPL